MEKTLKPTVGSEIKIGDFIEVPIEDFDDLDSWGLPKYLPALVEVTDIKRMTGHTDLVVYYLDPYGRPSGVDNSSLDPYVYIGLDDDVERQVKE